MTVDEYISAQEPAIAERLTQVCQAFAEALPDAEERIAWNMPTCWQGSHIIHYAAAKKHIGIYPGSAAVAAFADRLTAFKTSKGAIQLPHTKELPIELLQELARWCLENRGHA
ncbi:iron chaperone [Collinsella vaginalis]|uniref:iron chaperone n=1 Tax=Collinsella vaginalis TaxID=1870987 RepID=UPI001C50057C|nr:DUF1801 domain-containing protein [Collinsella vaginalis]